MKQCIIKLIYSIVFIATSITTSAQDINIPDPFSSLSENQIEHLEKVYGTSVIRAARSAEVAYLRLDPYTSIEMGKLKIQYNKDITALRQAGKTKEEYNKEKDIIKQRFHSRLIALIGEEKFAQRQQYIEYRTEWKYMLKYGFSADQIAAYSHEAFKTTQATEIKCLELSPEIAIMMGELVVAYKTEKAQIKKSGTTPKDIKSALKLLSESHDRNVRILIGEDKYQIWKQYTDDAPRRSYAKKHGLQVERMTGYSIDAIKTAKMKEIKLLCLSPLDALEMGKIKTAYKKSRQEVSPTDPERKIKKQELKNEYHRSLKQLLGNEKFAQWTEYRNHALERKYIKKYGFTMEQFQQYQELANRQAVTVLRIRSSAIPKEEKRRRIQEAKEEKVASLRQILPSEQFDKWHKAYLDAKEKKKISKS